jgi:hypothetical protein
MTWNVKIHKECLEDLEYFSPDQQKGIVTYLNNTLSENPEELSVPSDFPLGTDLFINSIPSPAASIAFRLYRNENVLLVLSVSGVGDEKTKSQLGRSGF